MSTADPVAVLRTFNEAINAHDIAAAKSMLADDADLRLASGRTLDVDGYARFLQLTMTAFPDLRVEVLRAALNDDVVIAEEMMTGTHRGEFAGLSPTQRQVSLPMVHVARVTNGRIAELAAYHDTAGIARQLGEL
jgi:steroid delta-isomerase-like uncharacterized protein